jgi:hypothetical protein
MLFTFRAKRRSHPSFSGKLLGRKIDRDGLNPDPRKKFKTFGALIVWRAPRHAGVINEDVDLAFLGLDGLDEVVAPSLGLNIERRNASGRRPIIE